MRLIRDTESVVRRDDGGQALMFTLVFLVAFGVWVAALMGLATTEFLGTSSTVSQRTATYTADSAVLGAIARVQADLASSFATSPCTSPEFQYTQPGSSTTVSVSCGTFTNESAVDTLSFTATSGGTTLVTAAVTFYEDASLTLPPAQITSWSDKT